MSCGGKEGSGIGVERVLNIVTANSLQGSRATSRSKRPSTTLHYNELPCWLHPLQLLAREAVRIEDGNHPGFQAPGIHTSPFLAAPEGCWNVPPPCDGWRPSHRTKQSLHEDWHEMNAMHRIKID